MSDEINRMLGQIDGKLDQVISTFNRHQDDDIRHFKEVCDRLDKADAEMNKSKGAKGVIVFLITGGAAAIGGLVAMAARAFGKGG